MRLRCPNCNTLIPASNINVERTIAICPKCDEVFNFGDRVPTRKPKPTDRKIKQPDNIQVSETADQLNIHWWILPRHGIGRIFYIIGGIALLLLGVVILLAPIILGIRDVSGETIDWTAILMMILSMGLPSLWGGSAILFDQRQIVVDNDQIKDIYRPIPSSGRNFHRDDVVDVLAHVNTKVTSGRRRYDIDVRLRDGTQRPFLTGITPERAEFIVQELTRYLTQADVEEFTSDELPAETEVSTFDMESQDDDTQAGKISHLQKIAQKPQGLRHS